MHLGWSVQLEESRFVEAPWIIPGKIVDFNPDHVWTPVPAYSHVPDGSFDEEFDERPPNGYVVVRLYNPREEHWLRRSEYEQIWDSEQECPSHFDASDDEMLAADEEMRKHAYGETGCSKYYTDSECDSDADY